MAVAAASPLAFAQQARGAGDWPGLHHYSRHNNDVFAAAINPAALASCPGFTAGLYAERKFMLKELTYYTLAAALAARSGGWGMHLHQFAPGSYRQTEAGLGYGRKLGAADLGISFHYRSVNIAGYDKNTTLLAGIGSIWRVSPGVQAGFSIYYPASGKQGREKAGYTYRLGLGCDISEQVLLAGEVLKEEAKPTDIRAGITYKPAAACMLMAGVHAGAARPYAGVAWQWNDWRIQVVVKYQAALGLTSALGFSFTGHTKQNKDEVK